MWFRVDGGNLAACYKIMVMGMLVQDFVYPHRSTVLFSGSWYNTEQDYISSFGTVWYFIRRSSSSKRQKRRY